MGEVSATVAQEEVLVDDLLHHSPAGRLVCASGGRRNGNWQLLKLGEHEE